MDRSQYARTTLEAVNLWTGMHMQICRQLLDCAAGTAKESLHLATELQTSTMEAAQSSKDYIAQMILELTEAPKQPLEYCQKSLRLCVNTAEQFYKLHLGNAQVSLRSAEQVVLLAQQTGTRMQESYKECADKLKTLYAAA